MLDLPSQDQLLLIAARKQGGSQQRFQRTDIISSHLVCGIIDDRRAIKEATHSEGAASMVAEYGVLTSLEWHNQPYALAILRNVRDGIFAQVPRIAACHRFSAQKDFSPG